MDLSETIDALARSGTGMQTAVQKGLQSVDNQHKANAIVSGNLLQNGNQKVIISENLTEKIAYIKSTIDRQKGTGKLEELPFVMLGEKDDQGNTIITDIIYEESKFEQRLRQARSGSLDTAEANFDGKLAAAINQHVANKNIKNAVVIHGHTHPQNGVQNRNLTTNFSIADMAAYQSLSEQAKNLNPNAQIMGMVVNEVGDFNIASYNTQTASFEKCDNIFLGEDKLPSYTEGNYFLSSNSISNTQTNLNQSANSNEQNERKIEHVTREQIKEEVPEYFGNKEKEEQIRRQYQEEYQKKKEVKKQGKFGIFLGKLKRLFFGETGLGTNLSSVKLNLPEAHTASRFNKNTQYGSKEANQEEENESRNSDHELRIGNKNYYENFMKRNENNGFSME